MPGSFVANAQCLWHLDKGCARRREGVQIGFEIHVQLAAYKNLCCQVLQRINPDLLEVVKSCLPMSAPVPLKTPIDCSDRSVAANVTGANGIRMADADADKPKKRPITGSLGAMYCPKFLKIVEPLYDMHMGVENMGQCISCLLPACNECAVVHVSGYKHGITHKSCLQRSQACDTQATKRARSLQRFKRSSHLGPLSPTNKELVINPVVLCGIVAASHYIP